MRVKGVWFAWSIAVTLAIAAGCSKSAGTADQDDAVASEETGTESSATAARRKSTERKLIELDPNPRVVFETNLGTIVLELDRAKAPKTVDHFMTLVEGGRYHGTIFHRVEKDYVVVGGVYDEAGRPTRNARTIPCEADNGLKNVRGTVAMSRDPADLESGSCEFFINVVDNEHLDHHGDSPEEFGFCVFGKVVEGMKSVVDKLAELPVEETEAYGTSPVEQVVLRSARRAVRSLR